jgi:hypothetical protein
MHPCIVDYLLECAMNSIEAGARYVGICIEEHDGRFSVQITDNGPGMDDELRARVLDPYTTDGVKHKHRKFGLGLSFLNQALELTEGEFHLKSAPGKGTEIQFSFPLHHIDCPPVGDLAAVLFPLLTASGDQEIEIERLKETDDKSGSYSLKKSELIGALGELESGESLILARKYLRSLEEHIFEGD